MKVLKGYVRNQYRPEGCIAESYIAEEAIEFCTQYLPGVQHIGIPIARNDDDDESELTHFGGRALKGGNNSTPDRESFWEAHRTVLRHIDDFEPYIQ